MCVRVARRGCRSRRNVGQTDRQERRRRGMRKRRATFSRRRRRRFASLLLPCRGQLSSPTRPREERLAAVWCCGPHRACRCRSSVTRLPVAGTTLLDHHQHRCDDDAARFGLFFGSARRGRRVASGNGSSVDAVVIPSRSPSSLCAMQLIQGTWPPLGGDGLFDRGACAYDHPPTDVCGGGDGRCLLWRVL